MYKIIESSVLYKKAYETIASRIVSRGSNKIFLGDKQHRVCRFCGRGKSSTRFKRDAHVIPESFGNKRLFSYYECDDCNHHFGTTIENDLGNWSKPHRTLARIVGKRGVPTLKEIGTDRGWRIEYDATGFHLSHYEDDPFFVVDEAKKLVTFELELDPYTPIAVLKAFVRIGLTLISASELPPFAEAMSWILEPDHSTEFLKRAPIVETFYPGPMSNDVIVVKVNRRYDNAAVVPYAFMTLTYGNMMYQVGLPTAKKDAMTGHAARTLPPLATEHPLGAQFGRPRVRQVDLAGREVMTGKRVPMAMAFEKADA